MADEDTLQTYQTVAEEYYDRHGDRSIVADLVERFLELVEDTEEEARIADVGCGPGWESATFSERGHDVIGIDLTPAFLRIARTEAPDAGFARMDMRELGIESGSIDGLWACASFLHVPREDAPKTLAAFHRVLRQGGVLCLSVKRGEGTRKGEAYEGDRREFVLYQPAQLRGLLREAGFEIVEIETDSEDWIAAFARA